MPNMPVRPVSQSENPAPCAECGEWMRATAIVCKGCGQAFVARPLAGPAKAVPWDGPPAVARAAVAVPA